MAERGVRNRLEIAVHLPGARGGAGGVGKLGGEVPPVLWWPRGVRRGAARTCHVIGMREEPTAYASGVV
jgi:hypothetical protein